MPNKNKKQNKNNKNGQLVKINGQGGYYTDKIVPFMRQIVPSGTFRAAGTAAGGLAGSKYGPIASKVGMLGGGYLGGQLSRVLGFGDYTVKANTIATQGMAIPEGTEVPTFKREGRMTHITHREFVQDIVIPAVPATFTNVPFTINAANSALFPWLAAIAANYQQYRFNGLVFEFKTLSSDITAGGALGAVILATNYDVNDVVFPSKVIMENSEYAVSAKPSLSQLHAIECDPAETAHPILYCRDSTRDLTTVSDNRLYDHGKFQLATSGLPGVAGAVLGELWVTYDVTLMKPEVASAFVGSTKVTGAGFVSNASTFGTNPVIAGSLVTAVENTLTFLTAGTFVAYLQITGTVFATPVITGTATTVLVSRAFPLAAAQTSYTLVYKITTTAALQTVVVDCSGSTTITASVLGMVACDATNFA